MNVNAVYRWTLILLGFTSISAVRAESARDMLRHGNRLYDDGQYTGAIGKYDEALVEQPQALEPKFNKADSYYRLDDLGQAINLYQEVAAGSKDMALVAKAKYNLGNCFFQRGSKQRDSDLQKALDDMKTSIIHWRQVLDMDPENEKAARNIEVARLTIKDIMDQLAKQQEQQQQQGQHDQQNPQQQQSESPQDQNQPQDPNEMQKQAQQQDPNQTEDQPPQNEQAQQQEQRKEQSAAPDATAQEILDREQQQNKEREIRQRAQYQPVEKDW